MGISVATSDDSVTSRSNRANVDWWSKDCPAGDRGRRLQAWQNGIESVSWVRRWASLIYYKYMTGRTTGPVGYNFSSTARPGAASIYSRAVFEAPRYNVIAQCSDALANRVYKARPFLQVCPIDGQFEDRFNARNLTNFMDAAFYELDAWRIIEQCGYDSRIWGDSFLLVDNGINNRITMTRLLADEITVDENECNTGRVDHIGVRLFVSKSALLQQPYVKRSKAAIDAVNRAPKSNNGFYFGGDIDYTDVIVVRKAWSNCTYDSDGNEIPGRFVFSVGDYCFKDEEWHRDHAPIARLPFQGMPTGYFSQGMAEIALGMQREVDRTMAAAWENFRRAAWPRIGIAQGSNVDIGKLGDKSNGVYYYTGKEPLFQFPEAMSADQFKHLEDTIRRIKERFRVSDFEIQGNQPRAESGVAKAKQQEINDQAHADLFQHLEDFVEDIGNLVVEAAEESKPKFTLPGRTAQVIDWNTLNWDQKKYYLRPFPVGRLSQSMAFRQQQIDTWYAQGAISRQTKMRLEQVPDTDGYQSLANAAADFVEMQLDEMIKTGEYQPPEPWIDIDSAYETASARYCYERTLKTPQGRTDNILKYLSALDEYKGAVSAAMAPPMPGPGMPGAGLGAPGPASLAPAPGAAPTAPGTIPGLPNLQPGQAPAPPAFPVPR